MRKHAYATGAGLRTTHWTQADAATWDEFVDWMGLDDPAGSKECGGYVAGLLQETTGHLGKPDCVGLHRNNRAVVTRSIAALDVDHASQSFVIDAVVALGCAMAAYTTWSHTEDAPRWRLLVPLSEDVKPGDYRLLVDALMHDLGAEMFDLGSREPERLMHRPSTQGSYFSHRVEGGSLDVKAWLARADELGLRVPAQKRRYAGTETYSRLTVDQQMAVDVLIQDRTEQWRKTWATASEWPVGTTDERGRGWDALARDTAWSCAKMAATPWIGTDDLGAEELYRNLVPEEVHNDVGDKWHAGLVRKAAAGAVDPPPWGDFEAPNVLCGLAERAEAQEVADEADDLFRGQLRLAYRLAKRYGKRLMFVPNIGWHHWDGKRWAPDGTHAAERAVDQILRAALGESIRCPELRQDVHKGESANGRKGILEIAGSLHPLVVAADDLDADPYLLNVANGTLDLRTQELRPHNPSDRLTKVCRAAYNSDATGGRWESFLVEVLPDPDVRAFLQRLIGVALLGAVREHLLPIWTGTGANGKGAAYTAILHALGDYACPAEPDLFMAREGAHPTGSMDLRGRRLVVVSESDEGRRLAEATMKRLTGGDPIKSRSMRKDFVTFTPSHLAILVTNHLPKVSGDDEAVWRRLRVVPFNVVIPPEKRDTDLGDHLAADADAVLLWAVQGWRAYAAAGHKLHEPASVLAATGAYRNQSDAVARFLQERCERNNQMRMPQAALYAAWETWARVDGAEPLSAKPFAQALERHGLPPSLQSHGTRYRPGVVLREDTDNQDDRYGQSS